MMNLAELNKLEKEWAGNIIEKDYIKLYYFCLWHGTEENTYYISCEYRKKGAYHNIKKDNISFDKLNNILNFIISPTM